MSPMAKLIPFLPRRRREAAAYVLALSARLERSNKHKPWVRPEHPERLGNLLQVLIDKRPALMFVFESIAADILAQLID